MLHLITLISNFHLIAIRVMVTKLFHAIVIISKSQWMRKSIAIIQKSNNYFLATLVYRRIILSKTPFNRLYHLCITNAISPPLCW